MEAAGASESCALDARGDTRRVRLLVRGVVQGVGFRPYVYQLAGECALAGYVKNTPQGAEIEVEGAAEAVDAFLAALPRAGPPLMRIEHLKADEREPRGDTAFSIAESDVAQEAFAMVPADVCVCKACLRETHDPHDRRFEYPFTNCTNCGPRYSIIKDVPYDRAQTTMAAFQMCNECRREYESPSDRRFHAQPNACPVCGPRLELVLARERRQKQEGSGTREILEVVARLLLAGKIVAWKGLGGYQLACDARNGATVAELRQRKRRNEKPFAVMVANLGAAKHICGMSATECEILTGPERPIVLLAREPGGPLAEEIFCGIPSAGLMLPSTPMHDLLFRVLAEQARSDVPLVMTSGNRSEEPIAIEDEDALRSLDGVADAFVLHNRPIHTRVDDSVVRVFEGTPRVLRRARGYAPSPIWLGRGETEVLACGAQLKNTLCLTKNGYALMSQHLGDLENYETLEFFSQTLERMKRLFHAQPQVVTYDLHPGYLSTQFAMKLEAERRVGVQHHHAHVAACMVEHGLEGDVIGVAWDGTGLGTDGSIWGGEFLVANYIDFTRAAHLRPVLLAGGDRGVREPWRIARAYLLDAFDTIGTRGIVWQPPVAERSLRTLDVMLRKRIQVVETSSCGRLFDAVASLIGLRHVASFEGQAAMLLEAVAADSVNEAYDLTVWRPSGKPAQVDTRHMIRQITEDTARGVSVSVISARFHNALAEAALRVCEQIRSEQGLGRVCLTGGCFQNVRLLRGCAEPMRRAGFEVFFPSRVPVNDGGIALGQAAIACERLRMEA
jgi:hydrogenase maturation protein HypF